MTTSKELAIQEPTAPQPLSALTILEYRNNRQLLLKVMQEEMKAGVDYGITPGTDRPALWKPGAEKLVSMFCFAPSFSHECERHEDGRHRTYTIKCTLRHRGSDTFLGDADAVCSTLETKYVAKFKTAENPAGVPTNPADFYNTCMKMGGKRSLIAAVLFVTGASDLFSQDLDDDEGNGKGANSGASGRGQGLPSRPGGKAAKAAAGLWTGTMASVTRKTYKDSKKVEQEYFILALEDGRSASTFDTVIAQLATDARDQIVKIGTKPGKKQGYFNVESFEVLGKEQPPKDEPKQQQQPPDPDLVPEPEDIPF